MRTKFRFSDVARLRELAHDGYSITTAAKIMGISRITAWEHASLHGIVFLNGANKSVRELDKAALDKTNLIGAASAAQLRRQIAQAIEDATNAG